MVISSSTRNLTGGLFEYRDLGAVALKGFAEGTPAWQGLGTGAAESGFEALHAAELTPLVGREEESNLLSRRRERAKRGQARSCCCPENPASASRDLLPIWGPNLRCSRIIACAISAPRTMSTARFTPSSNAERAAGFKLGDEAQARIEKLNALLEETSTRPQDWGS